MGERTGRIEVSPDGHNVPQPSPDEAVRLLGAQIAALRDELGGLVAELDRRRHEVLDLRLQVRRHVVAAIATAVSTVGAMAGIIWLGISRARRRGSRRACD
jgi:hypothetical protein